MSALNKYQDPYAIASDFTLEDVDKEYSLRKIIDMRDELLSLEYEFRSLYGNVAFSKLSKLLALSDDGDLYNARTLLKGN